MPPALVGAILVWSRVVPITCSFRGYHSKINQQMGGEGRHVPNDAKFGVLSLYRWQDSSLICCHEMRISMLRATMRATAHVENAPVHEQYITQW